MEEQLPVPIPGNHRFFSRKPLRKLQQRRDPDSASQQKRPFRPQRKAVAQRALQADFFSCLPVRKLCRPGACHPVNQPYGRPVRLADADRTRQKTRAVFAVYRDKLAGNRFPGNGLCFNPHTVDALCQPLLRQQAPCNLSLHLSPLFKRPFPAPRPGYPQSCQAPPGAPPLQSPPPQRRHISPASRLR